jgi:acyl transferase domain-containing protein/NADPH:quinone reductase-like Zn-dependent oxidoreductase
MTTIDYRALLKRAHDTLEEMQARLASAERARREPIAVVGMGVRFPGGAVDAASLWRVLHDGIDVVTEVPRERWDVDAFYDPDPDAPGRSYTRWGAFLDRIDEFDPAFFGISPREAAAMDPQQRLLLEVTWEALESAGRAGPALGGSRTGVFVGMAGSDFAVLPRGDLSMADTYFATGAARSIAAGRLSYLLGLHGPSLVVDTACSSSAVATHLACQSLRAGESDMALAGGVNVMLAPDGSISTSRGRMMSFTGRCRTFDAAADGYVRAEGCAMLVLRRLSDALADGDEVLAVILGSAVNQDGRSNGITAPNAQAQEAVIRAALADAGIAPAEVGLVEAHGTGTTLGDPIEMRALGAVFAPGRRAAEPLLVGAVKTNIGHTEGVAGTAGLIKAILALRHRTVPPNLHLSEPNPLIPWDSLPVQVPTEPVAWEVGEGARRVAGVSSFGFSGTNSHIVVAEPPPPAPRPAAARSAHLLCLSARTPAALAEAAERHERHLATLPAAALADAAFTLGAGRTHLTERLAVVADTPEAARAGLAAWRAGEEPPTVLRGTATSGVAPEIAFLFTGQGAQYVGMACGLWEQEPVFREALQRCDELLRPHLDGLSLGAGSTPGAAGRSLLGLLYPEPGAEAEAERLLAQTAFTQPALFAVEFALARLWMSWGIRPTLVAGHSVGEYVAACVAGVFSLEDAIRLIAARGRLMQALPGGGAMAAVFADEPTVAAAVAPHAGRVSIAAVNAPRNVVVSGDADALREILAELARRGIQAKPLRVSHAFHSPLMEPMLDAFGAVAASVAYSAPRIGLVSNVTGRIAGPEITTADYWRRHVRAPVRFADTVRTLHDEGCTAWLEIGPSPTLLGLAQQCLATEGTEDGSGAIPHSAIRNPQSTYLASVRRDRDDARQMLESLAALHVQGAEVDWAAVAVAGEGRRRVQLPTYPFQRKRYWLAFPEPGQAAGPPKLHPLLHERLRSPMLPGTAFQSRLGVGAPAYLDDHRIHGAPLLPAAAYLEMAAAAARRAVGGEPVVHDLRVLTALRLPESGTATVQVALGPFDDGAATVRVFSLEGEADDRWTLHAEGRVGTAAAEADAALPTIAELQARLPEAFPADAFYGRLEDLGVDYGPEFRCIREIRRRDGEALGRIRLPADSVGDAAGYELHPALLDACIQLLGAAIPGATAEDASHLVHVPVEITGYRLHRAGRGDLWCHAVLEAADEPGEELRGSLSLFADDGAAVAEIRAVRLRPVARELLRSTATAGGTHTPQWLWETRWAPSASPSPEPGRLSGRWIILADQGGVAESVAAGIRDGGGSCALLRREALDPLDPDAFAALVAAPADAEDNALRGIVHLWSLDEPAERDAGSIMAYQRDVCGSVLSLVRSLSAVGAGEMGLWLATRAAQAVGGSESPVSPEQAPVWGLAGSVALEHPAIRCVCIDLDRADSASEAAALLAEITAADAEDRVAWRNGSRFVARLAPYSAPPAASGGEAGGARELVAGGRGVIDDLAIRTAARRAPGPGEVEIAVRASGLNFRDVLNVLGMYPGDAGPLGSECAGVITAVGEGVHDLAAGDLVLALAGGTFRSHVVVAATSAYPLPGWLGFDEAAALPLALLTAHHGLHELAGMRKGDRVLIHAAAGGVGMAAVQLALEAGAEVFGTAGSDEKRALLRSLGVRHVLDSRSLGFAAEILRITDGTGVDVVLNSLADDFIPASLGVVAEGGCFLEIGKRGIWSEARVAERYPSVRYHAYDLADVVARDSGWMRISLDRLLPRFEAGALRPPPLHRFPLGSAADAFRFMAQARHTGKIVLTQEAPEAAARIRDDATYLVTGGLGGIGLRVARWLVDQGARSIALVGRSAPGEAARDTIEALRGRGARVTVLQADVASADAVADLLRKMRDSLPPLRGVLHAAGVVDDGMLVQQEWPRFETVMAPKISGAWNLHTGTRDLPLDFFVLFSAASTLLGSAGQGNYAAANAFLDALAWHRRAAGLPATSIGWGAWEGVGMTAALDARDRQRWEEHGIGTIAPADGLRLLERVLEERPAHILAMPVDWPRLLRHLGAAGRRPLFRELPGAAAPSGAELPARPAPPEPALLRDLETAEPGHRLTLLRSFIEASVRRVLSLGPTEAVGSRTGFTEMGMDSLMAVELGNLLSAGLGRKLPTTVAFEHPTLDALAEHLAAEVVAAEPPPSAADASAPTADPSVPAPDRVARIAALSDDEAEDTLLEELERAGY